MTLRPGHLARLQYLERLRYLAHSIPGAEIARKSGATQSAVARYMKGASMPLEFGIGLVAGLGVNPEWLLTGQGPVLLSDVRPATASAAAEMLDLIGSLRDVESVGFDIQPGESMMAFGGRTHEAMREHAKIKANLDRRVLPVFSRLLDALGNAAMARNTTAAASLNRLLEQLSHLCGSQQLLNRFGMMKAKNALHTQRMDVALTHLRALVRQAMLDAHDVSAEQALHVYAYVTTLGLSGQIAEARRMSLVFIDFLDGNGACSLERGKLMIECGWYETELGNIAAGLPLALDGYDLTVDHPTETCRDVLMNILLFSGRLSIIEAMAADGELFKTCDLRLRFNTSSTMLSHCARLEDPDALRRGLDIYFRAKEFPSDWVFPFALVHARALLACMERPRNKALNDYLATEFIARDMHDTASLRCFAFRVVATQLARYTRAKDRALTFLVEADAVLRAKPANICEPLIYRAIHYRNALELIDADAADEMCELRQRAANWYRDHCDGGYWIFADIADRFGFFRGEAKRG